MKTDEYDEKLFQMADETRRKVYKNEIYIRGLIEISNYCKNNCFYCGLRSENKNVLRYRMTETEILECCQNAYKNGCRTFVLQGGEDAFFSDEVLSKIIFRIKQQFSDCAVTLSLGERSFESYKALFAAGADRYLLRHETADENHYKLLHPKNMKLENRKKCLFDLKKIGYQVGSGFIVGSPFQTLENIVSDIRFLQELSPNMIGIGPFVRHNKTPFSNYENGSVQLTIRLVAVLRLLFPFALIPATTALSTLQKKSRELALKAGANVIMPNFSPSENKKKYEIYENKDTSSDIKIPSEYKIVIDRGDVKK